MTGAQSLLEVVLTGLLAATLFHAFRLERALGVLKRDRAALEELVARFNDSTQQAEQGIERLCRSAEGAGRKLSQQIEQANSLTGDLTFLLERSEAKAVRLESAVRASRLPAGLPAGGAAVETATPRFLDEALSTVGGRLPGSETARPRSKAERDLLRALGRPQGLPLGRPLEGADA